MILQTHQLGIGYKHARRARHFIAQNLNLTLQAGELVCLIGQNGAGKSTLLRTLAGMQPPLSGSVTLMGESIQALSAGELARRLSVVLTDRPNTGLLSGYELVSLGRHPYTDWTGRLSAHDEAVIRESVAAVGAETLASQRVEELSDGQRQRLMIARALAQEPALMLLDEPTAFLDLPRRVDMMRLLKQLTRTTQRAILLSTHDLDLALRTADCIWLMASDGTIHSGAPEDLILNGAFEAVFQSEGLLFDRQTGAFKIQPEQMRHIQLHGDGLAFHWTQRALERSGYQIADSAAIQIHITETGWTLNQIAHYPTLYALIQGLDMQKPASSGEN